MANKKINYYLTATVLLAPAAIIYIVFLIVPLLQSVWMSFFTWNGIATSPMEFVGLRNYERLISDPEFYRALINAGWFILGSFLIQMPIAFGLALIISSRIKGIRFFKASFFMPVILPITAVGLMFTFILNPNTGLLNTVLKNMSLDGLAQNWLADPKIAIFSVVMVSTWIYAGLNMLIFASGLTNIPSVLYEAAKIDGANFRQTLRHITIPMLRNTFVIYSVLAITGSLRTFDLVFVMTEGGPNGATYVPALYLYNEAFRYNNFGLGNATGAFILVLGLLISSVVNKFSVDR